MDDDEAARLLHDLQDVSLAMLARRAQLSQVLDLIDKGLIVEADAERVLDVIEVENVMLDRLNALIDRLLALFPDRPSPPLH